MVDTPDTFDTPDTIAFIGLGTMGLPMARQLARARYPLRCYDPDAEAAAALAAEGAKPASSPREAADGADIVICMLPHPDVLREVLFGERSVTESEHPPALVVDMSTSGPVAVRDCGQRLGAAGIDMVDAPVGKGPWAAETGELTILLGGEEVPRARAEPVLRHIGSTVHRCGPLGSGQAIKLANNLAACVNIAVAVEAWSLAVRSGADPDVLMDVMPSTSADSWQLRHTLSAKVLRGDFTPMFKLGLAHKDLRLVLEAAAATGTPVDTTRAALGWYDQALTAGYGDLDWGAVALVADPSLREPHG